MELLQKLIGFIKSHKEQTRGKNWDSIKPMLQIVHKQTETRISTSRKETLAQQTLAGLIQSKLIA